jgi:hypothetical protein
MKIKVKTTIDVLGRYMKVVERLANDPRAVLIRHHYVFALLWNTRFREAVLAQAEASQIAARLCDGRSKAYALAGEILVSTIAAPQPQARFEPLKKEAISAVSTTTDSYIQSWTRYAIGWDEFHRGRMKQARDAATDLMRVGQESDDPRATGVGLSVLALIALLSASYPEALQYSEESMAVAVTPIDRETGVNIKGCALVLLKRTEEGLKILEEFRQRCLADGDLYSLSVCDVIFGVAKVHQGDIGGGLRWINSAISRREKEGYRTAADWHRLILAEVYLQIITRNEKPSFAILLRNLPVLVRAMFNAPSRIRALMTSVFGNPELDTAGHHVGHAKMILGLLYKIKKKRPLALEHLTEARRILSQFGQTPILARVDAALAELGQ